MADYITRVFQCFVARVSTSLRKHSLHLFITSSLKDFGSTRLLSPVTCLCPTEAAVLKSARCPETWTRICLWPSSALPHPSTIGRHSVIAMLILCARCWSERYSSQDDVDAASRTEDRSDDRFRHWLDWLSKLRGRSLADGQLRLLCRDARL